MHNCLHLARGVKGCTGRQFSGVELNFHMLSQTFVFSLSFKNRVFDSHLGKKFKTKNFHCKFSLCILKFSNTRLQLRRHCNLLKVCYMGHKKKDFSECSGSKNNQKEKRENNNVNHPTALNFSIFCYMMWKNEDFCYHND